MIDLRYNYPILPGEHELFRDTVSQVLRDDPRVLELAPYSGREEHRQVAAEWLGHKGKALSPGRVLLTTGGHHAVMVILLALKLRGKKIAVDPLTYSNFKTQSDSLGMEMLPCDGDEHGMRPEALAQAAGAGAKAVYLMPTVHNPLGTVMPESRRHEICEVARRHDLLIVDDDAYRFMEADPPPSFALLAPERSFTIWSFTKPFAPVMKIAFLAFPEQHGERLTDIIRVTTSGPSVLFCEVARRLIRSGEMTRLLEAKRAEAAERQKLVRATLDGCKVRSHSTSYHIWVDLPDSKPAKNLAEQLAADGILVSYSDHFKARPEVQANGIRVGFGGIREMPALQKALKQVRSRIAG